MTRNFGVFFALFLIITSGIISAQQIVPPVPAVPPGVVIPVRAVPATIVKVIPSSNIDDPHANGPLAWPANSGGLPAPFPIMLWPARTNNGFRRGENEIHCGPIPTVLGGRVVSASYPYQTQFGSVYDALKFECRPGRNLVGYPVVKCLPNGVWSTAPYCSRYEAGGNNQDGATWLTSPTRGYDEIAWPDWFTTIMRPGLTTPSSLVARRLSPQTFVTGEDGDYPVSTPADDGSETDEATTTPHPFIIRIGLNIAGLFQTPSPYEDGDTTMDTQRLYYQGYQTTAAPAGDGGILSNRAAYIGIIVGSCIAGLLIFGLTIFFLLRLVRKLAARAHAATAVASSLAARDLMTTPAPPPSYYSKSQNPRRTSTVNPTPRNKTPTPANTNNDNSRSIDRTAEHPNVIQEQAPPPTDPTPTPNPTSPPPSTPPPAYNAA